MRCASFLFVLAMRLVSNVTGVVYRVRIALLTPMLNHFSGLILLKLSYCLRVFHVLITFSRYDFSFDQVFSCSFNFLMAICSLC